MTTRVIDCQAPALQVARLRDRDSDLRGRRSRTDIRAAAVAAMLTVPLAGAAEPPVGWFLSALTAMFVLCVAPILGQRAHWGRLTLIFAGLGLALPRGQFPAIGPALFVATLLAAVLWLTNHPPARGAARERPAADSPSRVAQIMLGLSGERYVGHTLGDELPEEYVVINGLKLPRSAGDIDHLVVGPTGVFVMETKTMPGRIFCGPDGTWHRTRTGRRGGTYDAFIGDPATQVQRNIYAVRECLRRRLPKLLRNTPLWIEGLVVFPHPRTELEAEHSRVPAVALQQASPRILTHVPGRPLSPSDVDSVVAVLLEDAKVRNPLVVRHSAQALIELALVLPVVLALVFGTVALSRLVQAQTAVIAVAQETARAGALAQSPAEAIDRMRQRASLVAPGLGLDSNSVVLEWDVTRFDQQPGQVMATVEYRVALGDLPLVGWISSPVVRAEHTEWIDPWRSGRAGL